MKEILLTRGQVALVDDSDYERVVSAGSWCAAKRRSTYYAVNGKRRLVYMHRFILRLADGKVDHNDGNGLNNQRYNLRAASTPQNAFNSRKRQTLLGQPLSSKFKGVHFFKRTGKWQSYINVFGQRIHLGYFDKEIDAALEYDAASKQFHGDFGKRNFS